MPRGLLVKDEQEGAAFRSSNPALYPLLSGKGGTT